MGVWIEIYYSNTYSSNYTVTPFMGVWIEIAVLPIFVSLSYCHSLHGSVD